MQRSTPQTIKDVRGFYDLSTHEARELLKQDQWIVCPEENNHGHYIIIALRKTLYTQGFTSNSDKKIETPEQLEIFINHFLEKNNLKHATPVSVQISKKNSSLDSSRRYTQVPTLAVCNMFEEQGKKVSNETFHAMPKDALFDMSHRPKK